MSKNMINKSTRLALGLLALLAVLGPTEAKCAAVLHSGEVAAVVDVADVEVTANIIEAEAIDAVASNNAGLAQNLESAKCREQNDADEAVTAQDEELARNRARTDAADADGFAGKNAKPETEANLENEIVAQAGDASRCDLSLAFEIELNAPISKGGYETGGAQMVARDGPQQAGYQATVIDEAYVADAAAGDVTTARDAELKFANPDLAIVANAADFSEANLVAWASADYRGTSAGSGDATGEVLASAATQEIAAAKSEAFQALAEYQEVEAEKDVEAA